VSRILVAGGAGYIGSHVCKHLAAAGHEPVVFDDFSTGWRDAVRFGPAVEGDMLDPAALAAAFARHQPEGVVHCAALSLVGDSMRDPARYWRANVLGTLNLVEAAAASGARAFVFSSTAAVYGETGAALIPETAPVVPANPYGGSKLAAERLIADTCAVSGMAAGIFRYFNVAGADPEGRLGEQHRPETHLVPLVLEAASGRREAIAVYGADYPTADGTCIRDYLHVEDLAAAHVLGLERLLAGGKGFTLNLGLGRGHSVREVIDCARRVTGRPIPETAAPRRPGDPPRLVCDGSRAMATLGWQPRHATLEAMIADAWAWSLGRGFAC
jgi:UDP-glucose 4-epimerase